MTADTPSASEGQVAPSGAERPADRPPFRPDDHPPPAYPPPERPAPDPAPPFRPDAYPPPAYPPGYPPGYPGYPPRPSAGSGAPRQHAWRTAYPASPGPPPGGRATPPGAGSPGFRRQGSRRPFMWLIAVVALVAILLRSHRITSDEIIVFCVLIPSVMLHEISHGVVALAFGDETAKRAGRISLNPLRHVTPWGTVIVPIITVLVGVGYFGWAKPVPVNVRNLRSPRNHGVLVALAGPLTNVVLAAIFGALFYFLFAAGHTGPVATSLGARILFYAGFINVWIACFNMIPIPPLDGSALLERMLPAAWWPGYLRLRPYGMLVIIGALVLMSFGHTDPVQHVVSGLLTWWARVVHAY